MLQLRYLNRWGSPSSSRRSSTQWESSSWEPSCRYVILGQLNWWQFRELLWSPTWWVCSVRSSGTSKCCLVIYYVSYSSDLVTGVWVNVFHYLPSKVLGFIVDPLLSYFAFGHCSHGGWVNVNRLS